MTKLVFWSKESLDFLIKKASKLSLKFIEHCCSCSHCNYDWIESVRCGLCRTELAAWMHSDMNEQECIDDMIENGDVKIIKEKMICPRCNWMLWYKYTKTLNKRLLSYTEEQKEVLL